MAYAKALSKKMELYVGKCAVTRFVIFHVGKNYILIKFLWRIIILKGRQWNGVFVKVRWGNGQLACRKH